MGKGKEEGRGRGKRKRREGERIEGTGRKGRKGRGRERERGRGGKWERKEVFSVGGREGEVGGGKIWNEEGQDVEDRPGRGRQWKDIKEGKRVRCKKEERE